VILFIILIILLPLPVSVRQLLTNFPHVYETSAFKAISTAVTKNVLETPQNCHNTVLFMNSLKIFFYTYYVESAGTLPSKKTSRQTRINLIRTGYFRRQRKKIATLTSSRLGLTVTILGLIMPPLLPTPIMELPQLLPLLLLLAKLSGEMLLLLLMSAMLLMRWDSMMVLVGFLATWLYETFPPIMLLLLVVVLLILLLLPNSCCCC
jgi:hypothetical protein